MELVRSGARDRLIGRAGEALVEAQLLIRGVNVARPSVDGDKIDLVALGIGRLPRSKFIQVKTSGESRLVFERDWFATVPDLVIVWVWHIFTVPRFFIFDGLTRVEEYLGDSAHTPSWLENGRWNVANVRGNSTRMAALVGHEDRWERILDPLSLDEAQVVAGTGHLANGLVG